MAIKADFASAVQRSMATARYAPSVHNSQPWAAHVSQDSVTIAIDWDHVIKHGDPTMRQTYLSLGIFYEALCIGLENQGFTAKSFKIHESGVSAVFAATRKTRNLEQILAALVSRTSDRSIYKSTRYDDKTIQSIVHAGSHIDASTWLCNDPSTISAIAQKTAQGIRLALSNPSFRKELSRYLLQPWSTKTRGIAVKSLAIPLLVAICEPTILRHGIALSLEPILEKKRWESASGVVLITTKGDLSDSWFAAGRRYLHVCLVLELMGISQATSAALVEASTFHEDIEAMLSTNERLQAVIRIGKGTSKRQPSPRISVSELLPRPT